jgi:xylulokinase
VRELLGAVDCTVAGIAIVAQTGTVVCVSEDGNPLRPAILWRDKRSAPQAFAMTGGFPSAFGYRVDKLVNWIRLANGAPSRGGSDATSKIRWVLENEPEITKELHYFLDARDWLIHRATGRFVTVADSANLTWLMDTRKGSEGWSAKLASMAGIDLNYMPPIIEATAEAGGLTKDAAQELGLPSGIPVFGGCSDVSASALGSGAVADGELHICLSTSSWISGFFPNRRLSPSDAYATVTSPFDFRPLLIVGQETAARAKTWANSAFAATDDVAQDDQLPRHDDPLAFPWLAGERAPVDDDNLRAAFLQISDHHDAAALHRATTEAIVHNTAWAWQRASRERGIQKDKPLPVVGGGAMIPGLAICLSAVTGRDIALGAGQEAGVFGAGIIAATAIGWRDNLWEAARTRAEAAKTTIVRATQEERDLMHGRAKQSAILRKHLLRATRDLAKNK